MLNISAAVLKRYTYLIAIIAALATICDSAFAVTIRYDQAGVITKIHGVDVLGELYTVKFIDGTYTEVHGAGGGIFENNNNYYAAQAASQSLFQVIYNDVPNKPDQPINGISNSYAQSFVTAARSNGTVQDQEITGVDLRLLFLMPYLGLGDFPLITLGLNTDLSDTQGRTWAVWSVYTVPLPPAYALMGSAILGLMGLSRRRQTSV